jgi:ATP/maltotriose-dependent transcriptional regulator MalT
MNARGELEKGRESFKGQAWLDAYKRLSAADRQKKLQPVDLQRLATAAYMMGKDEDSAETYVRAHQELVARGDAAGAARCAFWIGFQLTNSGDMARAGGWFARARKVLPVDVDCVEQGYLLVPIALQNLFGGDPEVGLSIFRDAEIIGSRFNDPDLKALSGLGQGQSLITLGRTAEGVATLDEVMVAVTTGEVSAIVVGLVYCAVVSACHEVFDLRRAKEWTDALSQWCASQPDLVPYRGQCLVHRAELMQVHGAWADAMEEAERARALLSQAPDRPIVGMAFHLLGDLHRLRGDLTSAEDAYRSAHQGGRSPQPGLAMLRLAQGRVGSADASIRRVLQEADDRESRSRILPAYVEIVLEAGDVPAARVAADELSAIAEQLRAPFLEAIAAHSQGSVHLAEGDALAALSAGRSAWKIWCDLEAPYEAARARLLIGSACRRLGDRDSADMEFDAARNEFQRLGAAVDVSLVEKLASAGDRKTLGLTGREVEVLALVATGKTNREISEDLVISEKTVARHLSNIFVKLEVSSRAAATAYAYQHDLA